jgi:putative ATP-dependent endonuclease of OLD family
MLIEKVIVKGFRNFEEATVNFNENSLIIGANDVGKTNFIHCLRILLDKSLSERDIEPQETDFHIKNDGTQLEQFSIEINFNEITEDAVLSILRGFVSDDNKTIFKFCATKSDLEYKFYVGSSIDELEEVTSRFYLKYINLKYVKSRRDLQKFIEIEKKELLKFSKKDCTPEESTQDSKQTNRISKRLHLINKRIADLNYIKTSTESVNSELEKLSHSFDGYSVHLDTGAIEVKQFIDKLQLVASNSGSKMLLGGDGRNNQILMALWKAKSEREFDSEHEVIFYCVEEPEAHLHPHQQRKLADYLNSELSGQTIITSHSPQITARYSPDSIIHLINNSGKSYAAKDGCSDCISEAWDDLGYRMSILPAEAFFAKCVFLVEGPSEMLFYTVLAEKLSIDLDFYNISILAVDGIAFKVYTTILDAMEIDWVMRTDNDVSKVQNQDLKNLVGINRCLDLANIHKLDHRDISTNQDSVISDGTWQNVSDQVNPKGIFLSKKDLENDLSLELPDSLKAFSNKTDLADAVNYLQKEKAIRMRKFLASYSDNLDSLNSGELVKPLLKCKEIVESSRNA